MQYIDFLNSNDGMSLYHGYYRMLGMQTPFPFTLEEWNKSSCWRFAWPDLNPSYFFIGYTAWGDQYGFDLKNVEKGVLLLDAYEMVEETIAKDFGEFIEKELTTLRARTYDSQIIKAYEQFGELRWGESIALIPPLLLVESEYQCQFNKMKIESLMIINGDIYTQLNQMGDGEVFVHKLETYNDDEGRTRIKLITG